MVEMTQDLAPANTRQHMTQQDSPPKFPLGRIQAPVVFYRNRCLVGFSAWPLASSVLFADQVPRSTAYSTTQKKGWPTIQRGVFFELHKKVAALPEIPSRISRTTTSALWSDSQTPARRRWERSLCFCDSCIGIVSGKTFFAGREKQKRIYLCFGEANLLKPIFSFVELPTSVDRFASDARFLLFGLVVAFFLNTVNLETTQKSANLPSTCATSHNWLFIACYGKFELVVLRWPCFESNELGTP